MDSFHARHLAAGSSLSRFCATPTPRSCLGETPSAPHTVPWRCWPQRRVTYMCHRPHCASARPAYSSIGSATAGTLGQHIPTHSLCMHWL